MNTNNPAELKVSLLCEGIDFDIGLFQHYLGQFYDNQFVYGRTSRGVTPEHRFPQVLLLGNGVVTALLRRQDSPWKLRIAGADVLLLYNKKFIQTVGLPERPAYFDRTLRDGTPTQAIIAVAGEDTPGFFFYPDCFYFPEGVPCGFCALRSTRRTVGKHMVAEFSDENITEATQLFQKTIWRDVPLISITMGTCRTDSELRSHVIRPIRVMYDALQPKIPIHVLAHPPIDFAVIDEFKGAGVTSIAFNIEVFDRDLFTTICPGKDRFYGYDKWLACLDYASRVFGDYRAYCGLVWGLEPAENVKRANVLLLDQGVGIASNIFHADPNCVLRSHPHPTEASILEIAQHQSELYAKNPQVSTIFPVSMRSTIDWEIRRGDFK